MTEQYKLSILILDDEKHFTEELSEYFENSGYVSFVSHNERDAFRILDENHIDLLILDVRLQGISGLDILTTVKSKFTDVEVIMISAHGDMDTVITAMRNGAFDYVRKPFRHVEIQIAIERSQKFILLQRRLKLMEEKNSLISKALEEKIDRQFIGISPAIHAVLESAITAANYSDASVLITGESGTGKENIARIIHYSSQRKDHLFCAVNSSAITDTLLDSEFFGHKKGSFTGATSDKMGFFEVSNNGTLFLDEIADMPLNLQSKILRAIEEKVITRVGDTRPIQTNFRIISATNHDIRKLVDDRIFRLDLFHRLNTLHIHIPPLRERMEDIRPLLEYFVETFVVRFNKPKLTIREEVFTALAGYEFPGNVRELKNMTERAIILCHGDTLGVEDFPVKAIQGKGSGSKMSPVNLNNHETELIREALKNAGYNQKAAAEGLGISRDSLIRKMKKYGITVSKSGN
jgi:DNA-binding NtrC family response regulator